MADVATQYGTFHTAVVSMSVFAIAIRPRFRRAAVYYVHHAQVQCERDVTWTATVLARMAPQRATITKAQSWAPLLNWHRCYEVSP